MPVTSFPDVEKQLTARRLDIQNLKAQLAILQGQFNTAQGDIATLTTEVTALENPPPSTNVSDGTWNGVAMVYKLASLFSAVVTFASTVILSALTASRPLKLDGSGKIITAKIDLSAPTTDIQNTLGVPNGGTGDTTFTAGSFLTGNGAGAIALQAIPIPVASGGTGDTTLTSGAYLKGNGTGAISVQAVPIPVSDGGTGAITLGASGVLVGNNTGAIIATSTLAVNGSLLGFFGGSLTAQQITAAYSSDPASSAYTGIAIGVVGTPYAQVTDLNSLRVAYETLRIMCEDLRTKLRTTGFIG